MVYNGYKLIVKNKSYPDRNKKMIMTTVIVTMLMMVKKHLPRPFDMIRMYFLSFFINYAITGMVKMTNKKHHHQKQQQHLQLHPYHRMGQEL